jgi:hypothetical protein
MVALTDVWRRSCLASSTPRPQCAEDSVFGVTEAGLAAPGAWAGTVRYDNQTPTLEPRFGNMPEHGSSIFAGHPAELGVDRCQEQKKCIHFSANFVCWTAS